MVCVKYEELVKGIRAYEEPIAIAECIYFKALEKLKDIEYDLNKLNEEEVKEIIAAFLILWGRMGRTVDRKDMNWKELINQLRNLCSKDFFKKLKNKSLLSIDESDGDAIKRAYNSIRVKYIGPTAKSKILHLLNPKVFVMWDEAIRKKYKVKGTATGYLKFLRRMKKELEEALGEKRKWDEEKIVKEICKNLSTEELRKECTRKTLAKLIDEYNWASTH